MLWLEQDILQWQCAIRSHVGQSQDLLETKCAKETKQGNKHDNQVRPDKEGVSELCEGEMR